MTWRGFRNERLEQSCERLIANDVVNGSWGVICRQIIRWICWQDGHATVLGPSGEENAGSTKGNRKPADIAVVVALQYRYEELGMTRSTPDSDEILVMNGEKEQTEFNEVLSSVPIVSGCFDGRVEVREWGKAHRYKPSP